MDELGRSEATKRTARGLFVMLALSAAISGCHAEPRRAASPRDVAAADQHPNSPHHHHGALPPDIVARSAMPFHGLRVKDGTPLPPDELMDALSEADAICVGEQHDNPHAHYAQLVVLDALIDSARMTGRELAIGFEMWQRPFQKDLDAYEAGETNEQELLEDSEWDERWGFDYAFYRPLVRHSRRARVPLIALNARRELTQKVARNGLSSLSEDEAREIPELDLGDKQHRAWFDEVMKAHPSPHGPSDDIYVAQVVWDETMADTAARWLGKRLPARQIMIVAGEGHCRDHAIPARLRRRTGAKVIGVLPVVVSSDDEDPRGELEGFDYGVILTPPNE
ncbi:MAG: ChaN family lipoprotein [Myxococcales bacterium]|nr:ChaN family lipoprotein [Myxococcales bacterium]MCB9580698.1 ChaN family lipoprotein [Polyangiaceae bacterium]